jgi:hypothetical protein
MKKSLLLLSFLVVTSITLGQVEPNAIYHLKNGAHLSYLNTAGSNPDNDVIHTMDASNGRAEWELVLHEAGFYKIRNTHSGLYIANKGSKKGNAPLGLQAAVGAGGLWSISGNSSTKFLLKNKLSGYYLSSAGRRNANAVMVQGPHGQYSYWDLIKVGGGSVDNSKKAATKVASAKTFNWQKTTVPSKLFGKWRISSRVSSRNDVSINGQYVIDGAMTQKIVRTYYYEGVYKIITTYNNYFSSYFVKERIGGYQGGGIYINSTVRQGFRSEQEAYQLNEPDRYDMGSKK